MTPAPTGHTPHTHEDEPLFTVTKGAPTEDEIAALTAVLNDLRASQQAAATPADRNGWGAQRPANHNAALYNPHAFGNVAYF